LLWVAVLLIAALGLALRLIGARGDLWLDEIWSLDLVAKIGSIDQIFWRINHDNNHYLNSAYLYLVGRDAGPLVARGLSIVLGTATVIAAAAFNAKQGRAAALATALLFAVSYPMVNYGSEARGFAGLVLFTILAVLFVERRLEGRNYGVILGLSILLGTLLHLTMLETVAVCGLWTLWVLWRRTGNLTHVRQETLSIFTPAVRFLMPLVLCIVVANATLGYKMGGVKPFTLADFAAGYGGMVRTAFGIPEWLGDWPAVALACAGALLAARFDRSRRGSLFVIGIVVLPAMMLAARLPNLAYPRYFLVSGTLLLLLAGSVIGRELADGGLRRLAAGLLLCAIMAGSALSLSTLFELGRGQNGAIVAQMGAEGAATYGTTQDVRLKPVVDYFAPRLGVTLTHVLEKDWCVARPTWIIDDAPDQPDRVDFPCGMSYQSVAKTQRSELSGASWTLYRRID